MGSSLPNTTNVAIYLISRNCLRFRQLRIDLYSSNLSHAISCQRQAKTLYSNPNLKLTWFSAQFIISPDIRVVAVRTLLPSIIIPAFSLLEFSELKLMKQSFMGCFKNTNYCPVFGKIYAMLQWQAFNVSSKKSVAVITKTTQVATKDNKLSWLRGVHTRSPQTK